MRPFKAAFNTAPMMVILTYVVTLYAVQDTVRSEHVKYALKTSRKS